MISKSKLEHNTTNSFQGMRNTARDHFGGGDTAWEEKNLGKYATRLVFSFQLPSPNSPLFGGIEQF